MIRLELTLLAPFLLLLLHRTSSETPEPTFRPVGRVVEMGYCFGLDYMLVYRVVGGKDHLLSNSSAASPPVTPPSDLQGRVHATEHQQLLGTQIDDLVPGDAGVYRRECWKNHTMHNQHTLQLIVCDTEMKQEEIIVDPKENGTEIACNSSAIIGQGGVSVRWYHDVYPAYTVAPLLDSSISLDPVDGILEVKNNGATLVLDKRMLHNNQHFYCAVYKAGHCLSFQELNMPEDIESRDVFASYGDRVFLNCEAAEENQYWDTPFGRLDNTDERSHQMFISTSEQHFSLVITLDSEEHFGDYSCVSSMSETQYSVVLCPRKESSETFTFENEGVTLYCDISDADSYMVHWYRRLTPQQPELMYDSGDESVPIPEDLRGRWKISDDDSAFTLLNARREDEGVYWCVVLRGTIFLEDDDDYANEYDEEEDEETTEGEFIATGPDWGNENQCLFKQETFLSVSQRETPAPAAPTTVRPRPHQPRRGGQAGTRAEVMVTIASLVTVFVLGRDR